MDDYKKHEFRYNLVRFIGSPIVRSYFNYSCESLKDIEGPYLLLANHTTDADAAFLGVASPKHTYFVATENITRFKFWGKILMHVFDPIIHYKGMHGIRTTRMMLRHLKNGRCVAMFPEGNRTFNGITCPIPPVTGQLAKACGTTLVTYRIKGGYFMSPRWHKNSRRGKVWGEIAGVYKAEELKKMSAEEVNAIIERDLHVDAYEEQKKNPRRYKGKDVAESLESAIFLCPKCGSINHLHSQGNRFFCDCGYEATFDEYGYLDEDGGQVRTVTELDAAQRQYIDNLTATSGANELFEDDISEEFVDTEHVVADARPVTLKAFADHFLVNDKVVSFDDIEAIAINQRNLLMLHIKGKEGHFQYRGPVFFNALKYLYVFRAAKGSPAGFL